MVKNKPKEPETSRALKSKQSSRAAAVMEKALTGSAAGKYFFRLYVAGATARSRQAVRRVYQLCEAELKDRYELEVIDVYEKPELTRANQIVATPTLVKEFPLPEKRFIGNLVNSTKLFDDSERDGGRPSGAGPAIQPKQREDRPAQ